MSADSDRVHRRRSLIRSVRQLPADLAAIAAVVVLTGVAILTPGLKDTPLRILIGLPFVLFAPGYAFIAALFPETAAPTDATGDRDADADSTGDSLDETANERPSDEATAFHQLTLERVQGRGSIDGIERVALAFGTSIAIVPLLGLVLNFTPWGIRLLPVFVAVGGFTLVAVAVAARRRFAIPPEARFRVPYTQWVATARSELLEPDTRTDMVLNVLLVMSVVLAGASVAYAVAVPSQGEAFTEFYVLTENETGDLVADDYPTQYTVGESKPLHVGIGNHEHRNMEYTVVIELQRVTTTNNTTQVQDARELDRMQAQVGDNQTWLRQVNITPPMAGERLRLAFLLYQDQPPAQPTVENAYRELHLWVNVTADESA
jgi:uncharacterized membrane protein